ncbi:MAG: hypothetical protein RSA44_02360, partial [Bacteroides sp.]
MKEEDEIRMKCGNENKFTVPEGYFDNLTEEIMNKLPEKEEIIEEEVTVPMWQRVKPWIYMAAMFAGMLFSIRVMIDLTSGDKESVNTAVNVDNDQPTDEYIETILDHSMMDDYAIYEYPFL